VPAAGHTGTYGHRERERERERDGEWHATRQLAVNDGMCGDGLVVLPSGDWFHWYTTHTYTSSMWV